MNSQFLNVVHKCQKDRRLEKMNEFDGDLKDKEILPSHVDGENEIIIVKSKQGCGHTRKAVKKDEVIPR
jgi:hypothetical protein